MWLSLLTVPLLIAANAFLVVAEYVVVAIRPHQIEGLRKRGRTRLVRAIESLKGDAASAIGAIQVGITMTNLLLGWIGEPAMTWLLLWTFAPIVELAPRLLRPVSTVLSFFLVTFLTVVFSELLPKALTIRFVVAAAAVTAIPITILRRVLSPLVWLMNKTANAVTVPLRLGRIEDLEETPITADELRYLAAEAAENGSVTVRTSLMIANAIRLPGKRAHAIMVHRFQVDVVDLACSMEQNRQVVQSRFHTRFPLCDGGTDHVIGIITAKEFVEAYYQQADISVLRLLAQGVTFVPESLPLDRLIEAFHQNKTEMLIVVSEYGSTQGIVTLRDVVDELFPPL